MLLYLEILLTVMAWRRGFGIFALIPIGLALFLGFTIGASAPASSDGDIFSYIWIDILAVIILGVMVGIGNLHKEEPEATHDSGEMNQVS